MSEPKPIYACLYAKEFPAQALLRLRPELREQPVVVLRSEDDTLVLDSGLKTGDTVVTAGAHVLTPNQHVTLYVEPTKR